MWRHDGEARRMGGTGGSGAWRATSSSSRFHRGFFLGDLSPYQQTVANKKLLLTNAALGARDAVGSLGPGAAGRTRSLGGCAPSRAFRSIGASQAAFAAEFHVGRTSQPQALNAQPSSTEDFGR